MSLRKCTKSRIVKSKYLLPEGLYEKAQYNDSYNRDRVVQLLLPKSAASWTGQQILYTNMLGLKSDQNFRILLGGIPSRIRAFSLLVDE